ncbi:uncharacterized protein BDR25DRAFT_360331 [Lindgomyces ingoldianus]|uniref:Uncharacterized protein n=1 Tax=Lindgomyces ingoldianus TaxID=673940 RepID=A0ACB6QFV1_9PLEO|nr:uncharacterized protein BDR25DRAFT_360331 [Lindgomyces ingoldianus]KAF2465804.1 hypothetical protein BDR25DRAFT_360331 [Lindgomyces ingoldianus]
MRTIYKDLSQSQLDHNSQIWTYREAPRITSEYKKTIARLWQTGIGPPFTRHVCFADLSPAMVYEVIQPVSGPSIFQELLDKHNVTPVIHHVAYDMNGIPFLDRIKDKNHFEFFKTEDATGTRFEAYEFPNY